MKVNHMFAVSKKFTYLSGLTMNLTLLLARTNCIGVAESLSRNAGLALDGAQPMRYAFAVLRLVKFPL